MPAAEPVPVTRVTVQQEPVGTDAHQTKGFGVIEEVDLAHDILPSTSAIARTCAFTGSGIAR